MTQTILQARSHAQSYAPQPLAPSTAAPATPQKIPDKARFNASHWMIALLLLTNTVFATGFFLSNEIDMIFGIREQQIVHVYEDRVTDLRMQIDRLRSSQVANRGNINIQMQELMRKQDQLSQRQNYVRSLANRAGELGISAAPLGKIKTGALDSSLITGSLGTNPLKAGTFGVLRQGPDQPKFSVDGLDHTISTMSAEADLALSALQTRARDDRDIIRKNLRNLGVRLPVAKISENVGGPFIAADDTTGPDEAFLTTARQVAMSFEALDQAKKYLLHAPLLQPIRGKIKVSSKFGSRRDPFHGKRAFHSGMDFKAKTGVPIRATGAGKVIYAGRRGGYGNSVEILHADGLTTRYGHMSRISVAKGAYVSAGQNIGAVGATGRATGPHLHYEVRGADGKVIDPAKFIRTGYKLRSYF